MKQSSEGLPWGLSLSGASMAWCIAAGTFLDVV